MSSLSLAGDTSGNITVSAPAVAGTNTLTLQAATATSAVNTLGTAVASTSGTSIDFTGLPSWIKRITVMFSGVSTNGTSNFLVQIGAGSVQNTGYVSRATSVGGQVSSTAGFIITQTLSANTDTITGNIIITTLGSNVWVSGGNINDVGQNAIIMSAGNVTLSGTLDRVRITTVNGTDTFDAGSVNLLYEG